MRRAITIGAAGLAALASAVLVHTARYTSRQVAVEPKSAAEVDGPSAAERLGQAVRFRTIATHDPAQFPTEEFRGLERYLEQAFPKVHATLTKEVVGDHSLLYTWAGSDPSLNPIMLMGHTDVVPVQPGTEGDWAYPPFEGRIAEGFVWGRGTMDNKAPVTGSLEAVETLLGRGFRPRRTVYLAFGHDEELGGQNGAKKIAVLLRSRGVRLEYVLDEGGEIAEGQISGVSAPVAFVGISEKGYLSLDLTVETSGGHSSMPPSETAIGTLAAAIERLEANQLPAGIRGVTRSLLDYVGPEMPFLYRVALANLWLFGPLVKCQLAASPALNALIRTTTAPTIFQAGVKDNVLPSSAKATVNFRILPGESIASVIAHVEEIVGEKVKVSLHEAAFEPSPVSSIETPGFRLLQRQIRALFPGTVVAPYLVTGATDSRHFADMSDGVYRFLPIRSTPEDLLRIHATNERLSVDGYQRLVSFLIEMIRESDGPLAD